MDLVLFLVVQHMIKEILILQKNMILEIKTVVRPNDKDEKFKVIDEAYPGPGVLINSDFLNGLKAPENSILETIKILEKKN